jgi:hypothetical protein
MTKKLSFERPNRRDFLRTGVIGTAGLVVAQFAAPKELRAQTTWMGQVDASSDDAQEYVNTGIPNLTATLAKPCNGGNTCGFRFTNVTVPNSATILAAKVSFDVQAAPVTSGFTIYMQAADNPVTFTTTKFDVSGRTKTTNYGVFSATSTGWTDSSDISAAVQEVVNRVGWASGSAMAVLTTHGISAGMGSVYTWDFSSGAPNYAAILTIQYM